MTERIVRPVLGAVARLRERFRREDPPDRHAAEREAHGAIQGEWLGDAPRGYFGLPVLRQPHWKWHVPLYFFCSGIAGGAFFVATLADWLGDEDDRATVAAGRYLALAGVAASLPLLIDDLGRPSRFHHMLRILKPRSPMSVGAWALTLFGALAGGSALLQARADGLVPLRPRIGAADGLVPRHPRMLAADELMPYHRRIGAVERALPRGLGLVGLPLAAFLASYTGVLLAATAVPLWGRARAYLGPIFFCSGMSTALAAISLASKAIGSAGESGLARLRDLELLALAGELVAVSGAVRTLGDLGRPLVARPWGPLFWGGSVGLGQVVPALLLGRHLLGGRRRGGWLDVAASIAVLIGGLATRFAIVEAGKTSADSPSAAFDYHR